jgi:SAM-dependent methyltransferase
MNIAYLVPRLTRHFLSDGLIRVLLRRGLVVKPGLETSDAPAAVSRYVDALESQGASLHGRRTLVFGYGGRFDIGVALLEGGAAHVILCDRYASPDDAHNRGLLTAHAAYLFSDAGRARPRPEHMSLLHSDIRAVARAQELPSCDLVVSSSVYEHLDDVEGVTAALARLTSPNGLQIHFVDLRDHFFKYPFEMLHYSEAVWRGWLNPSSNHNRFRLWDYRRVFETHFGSVEVEILGRDDAGFDRARNRVKPEYISGNQLEDAATLIRIIAAHPRR